MRALVLAVLLLGCARAATSRPAGDDAAAGDDPPGAMTPDGRAAEKGQTVSADGAAPTSEDGAADPGIIPPSQRDGGIPRQPTGAPPCAADSNAGDGNVCPYKAIVECSPVSDARPVQVCICLGSLGGKWYCMNAPDGGGVRPFSP